MVIIAGSNVIKVLRSGGINAVPIDNIVKELKPVLTKNEVETATGRFAIMKALKSLASKHVEDGIWNAIVCEREYCDWDLPLCSEVFLILLYHDFYIEVAQCVSKKYYLYYDYEQPSNNSMIDKL